MGAARAPVESSIGPSSQKRSRGLVWASLVFLLRSFSEACQLSRFCRRRARVRAGLRSGATIRMGAADSSNAALVPLKRRIFTVTFTELYDLLRDFDVIPDF